MPSILVMSSIFSLECCEHKQGPPVPQIGPLAFNRLHTPFYTPILSSPPLLLLPRAILLPSQKAAQNSLNFGCLQRYSQLWLMNRQL